MSEPKSSVRPASVPKPALDAVMADKSGNPLRRACGSTRWTGSCAPVAATSAQPLPAGQCGRGTPRFLVESPVWHAKLRLAEAQLLDAARSIGLKATRVTIKTASTTPSRSPAIDNRNGPTQFQPPRTKGYATPWLACRTFPRSRRSDPDGNGASGSAPRRACHHGVKHFGAGSHPSGHPEACR